MNESISPSKNDRRLSDAFEELPAAFPTNRTKSESETLSNHRTALRFRLDYLVRQEDEFGDEQRHLHRNRAERNALLWALEHLSPGERPEKISQVRPASKDYVRKRMDEMGDLLGEGFTCVHSDEPGLLFHKLGSDIAPVEVPLAIWFYFRGLNDGTGGATA